MGAASDAYPLTEAVAARLDVLASTGSTNADLVRAAAADPAAWPHLSVIVTDDQRAGRGRLDRSWEAPPGSGLAVSVLVRVPGIPARARGWIPLVAGAAMARAVAAQVAEAGHDARVKWPNDVLLDGRKLGGILAQRAAAGPVVVGLGLNVGWAPDGAARLGDGVEVADVLAALLVAYDALPEDVHPRYLELLDTVGREVVVELPDGELTGRAVDVERDGRLVVIDACAVTHRVDVGDVVHARTRGG